MTRMDQEDNLLKSLFQEGQQRPMIDITEQVMNKIDGSSSVFEYRPIIGKKAWIGIACFFMVMMIILLIQSEGIAAIQTSDLFLTIGGFFAQLSASVSFDLSMPELPRIPSTLVIAVMAINIVGVYLMVSFRWAKNIFK